MAQKAHCPDCTRHKAANRVLERKILELEEKLVRDSLTNLYNKHGFVDAMKHAVASAQRYQRPLCFAMIDLDHFKWVNDEHGHPVGDKVLEKFGKLLLKNSRDTDYPVRLGGEEFGIILPDTDIDGAFVYIDRFRKIVAKKLSVLSEHGDVVRCTVSIGVGQYEPGQSPDAFVKRVDTALYAAKHAGRNQVIRSDQMDQVSGSERVQKGFVDLGFVMV